MIEIETKWIIKFKWNKNSNEIKIQNDRQVYILKMKNDRTETKQTQFCDISKREIIK